MRFLLVLSFLLSSLTLTAEDVKLREQAVHLLEHTRQVSLLGVLPAFRSDVSFRLYDANGTPQEGSFSRVVVAKTGVREEENFGDFHAVTVRAGDRLSSTTDWKHSVQVMHVRELLPVPTGWFDHEDIIRSIDDENVGGAAAKCINFDTKFGDKLQQNQICVDATTGATLRWQVGEQVVEASGYYQVGQLWEPAHLTETINGTLHMEIDQKISVIQGPVDPKTFAPPTGQWMSMVHCNTVRPLVAVSTPQPPPGDAGSGIVDVVVGGAVRENGRTELLTVKSSPRADLNAEAIDTVANWSFEPYLCNGKPATLYRDFIVHFQGR